ncbi:MAG TPA: carboxypeptidase-like regulatory domain-containing protein [Pyrinomonadaceae bacterium]|nr:carboxypeptidase-like regulatory domain-containing protein [Pyrinomonadaceae bacterium]
MNAKQEAKFTMYRTSEQILDANSALTATITALATAIAAFKAIIAQIGETDELVGANLTGIAADKENSKQFLAQFASDIAAIIKAYASATKNQILKAEINFPVTKLTRLRDESLTTACRLIHTRTVENAAELKDFGITNSKITELDTAINEYTAKTQNPRTAVVKRSTQTANLVQLFKQADEILKDQIDGLMKNFRTSNPDIYNDYTNAREIVDAHTTVTQLKGTVMDATDEKPIKGAVVTIVELGISKTTNLNGEYSFKPAENGTFTLKIEKEGYAPYQKEELNIKTGHVNHWHASLVGE